MFTGSETFKKSFHFIAMEYCWLILNRTYLIICDNDYLIGIKLQETENQKKRQRLLWTSIIVNVGFLGFFKYSNFFIDNFVTAFSLLGQDISQDNLNIILPVGISFYTFQTMSYTIDVYRKQLEPTKDIVAFFTYVAFFPQFLHYFAMIKKTKKLMV